MASHHVTMSPCPSRCPRNGQTSLPQAQMKMKRDLHPSEFVLLKPNVPSNGVFETNVFNHVDVVPQATDPVEGVRKMQAELPILANHEQVQKVLGHETDYMLMQAPIYPKDVQVHQLVFFMEQCAGKDEKSKVPETGEQNYRRPCHVQQEVSEHVDFSECVDEKGSQRRDIGDGIELCGRTIHFDVATVDESGSIGDRLTKGMVQGMSDQDEVDGIKHYDDRNTSALRNDSEIEDLGELVKKAKLSCASTPTSRLRVLPILTANMTVKGVRVPQLPRGRKGRYSGSDFDIANTSIPSNIHAKAAGGSFRYQFQFSDKEVLQLLNDEEANVDSALCPPLFKTYRRLSTNSTITVAVPLRRKSFSSKRNSPKCTGEFGSSHVAAIATFKMTRASALSSETKMVRNKPTSPSMSLSRRNSRIFSFAFNSKKKAASPRKNLSSSPRSSFASSPPSPVPTTQTKMVLRVHEAPFVFRTIDGVPELVVAKKPVRFVMWHSNDRCVRVPFMSVANYMELGPAQHGIMLRQVRYVKLMMYELPWAKAHLRALLSKYTAKEMSKEELYPQLNALGQQVQRDINVRARQHRVLTARKQRLKVTLTLATSVVNDTNVTKYGRRGRPHASRLRYDPAFPSRLHWRRKNGEWSAECLALDEIQVIEVPDSSGGAEPFGREKNKTIVVASAVDPNSCLSFVTRTRSLDLQVASSLHREWLANAVRDLVSCAQQHKAPKAQVSATGRARACALARNAPNGQQ